MKKVLGLIIAAGGLALGGCQSEMQFVPHEHAADPKAMLVVTFVALVGLVAYKRRQRA